MTSKRRKNLKDKAYAYAYAFGMQDLLLAAQIKRLRKAQNLSQKELADRAGMKQARISLMESGDYSQWSVTTLRQLAKALNVGLSVEFSRFYATLDKMEDRDIEKLSVPTRSQEEAPTVVTTASAWAQAEAHFARSVGFRAVGAERERIVDVELSTQSPRIETRIGPVSRELEYA